MMYLRLLTLAALVAVGGTTAGHADEGHAHDVTVDNAYAWINPAGNGGGVFMTVNNEREEAVRIVAGESSIAKRVELHTHVIDVTGVSRMQEIEDGIPVDGESSVMLEPGSLHVMLMGIEERPEVGSMVDVMLRLQDGDRITLEAMVMPRGEKREPSMEHDHHDMEHDDHNEEHKHDY